MKNIIIGVFVTVALTFSTISNAQDSISRLNKYNYKDYTAGISMFKEDDGVQKCLKWVIKAPVNHPKRSPSIEHALYDIGKMGQSINQDTSRMSEKKLREIREITQRGSRAITFCNALPEFQL